MNVAKILNAGIVQKTQAMPAQNFKGREPVGLFLEPGAEFTVKIYERPIKSALENKEELLIPYVSITGNDKNGSQVASCYPYSQFPLVNALNLIEELNELYAPSAYSFHNGD